MSRKSTINPAQASRKTTIAPPASFGGDRKSTIAPASFGGNRKSTLAPASFGGKKRSTAVSFGRPTRFGADFNIPLDALVSATPSPPDVRVSASFDGENDKDPADAVKFSSSTKLFVPDNSKKKNSIQMKTWLRRSVLTVCAYNKYRQKVKSKAHNPRGEQQNGYVCVQYSPTLVTPPQPSPHLYDFEANQWRSTFNKMGGLRRLYESTRIPCENMPEVPKPFTDAQLKPSSSDPNAAKPLINKNDNTPTVQPCNRVPLHHIPRLRLPARNESMEKRFLSGEKVPGRRYFPKSTLRVRWHGTVKATEHKSYTSYNRYPIYKKSISEEDICRMMRRFGPVAFVTTEQSCKNSMIVTFQSMKSAYSAKNYHLHPPGVVLEWLDIRFNNFGHYKKFQDYTVITDKRWADSLRNLTTKAQAAYY